MFQRLTNPKLLAAAQQQISELFAQHAEWFCTPGQGQAQALRRNELDISIAQGRLVLSCWTEMGSRAWRILAWQWNGQVLSCSFAENGR